MLEDNIAAISTGLTASGVAVIRLSGNSPLSIAGQMFKPLGDAAVKDFEPNKMYVGEILAEDFKDFGMCVYFKAPKSFTGEDVVEFHCHGGVAITQGILKKILSLGARLADRGEFTKRAFLNGKLSLASAEGLIDMINSETVGSVRAGYSLYREKLTNFAISMQNELTDVLSEIDADMDFPEEDLQSSFKGGMRQTLTDLSKRLDGLIASYRSGRVIKNGVKVAVVGKPNVGKSSLFNALLNYDKAIVSGIAGTTRDVVEGTIDVNGVRFHFSDTAGIRESGDEIEKIGVDLSRKVVKESDLVIFVIDASDTDKEDEEIYREIEDFKPLVVMNKTDKSSFKDDRVDLYVSALSGEGIDDLRDVIFKRAVGEVDVGAEFLCEERHYDAFKRAKNSVDAALANADAVPIDLTAIDIKNAWDALGEISGKTATEEIINNIFSKFCVGK